MREAWLFNLDAEKEFELGSDYRPDPTIAQRIASFVDRFPQFLRSEDVRLVERWTGDPATYRARCWCPTPFARARLKRWGFTLDPAPSLEVLRTVNHRRFALPLEPDDFGGVLATSADEAIEAISRPSSQGWRLKRPWGFGGRGQRRRLTASRLNQDDRTWIDAALEEAGSLVVEPEVEREADFVLHGWIDAGGRTRWGRVCQQRCDADGVWKETNSADIELARDEENQFRDTATRVADALQQAGYFGPVGLDAFRWRDSAGHTRFRPLVDLNARYTTGWFLGMFPFRPEPTTR